MTRGEEKRRMVRAVPCLQTVPPGVRVEPRASRAVDKTVLPVTEDSLALWPGLAKWSTRGRPVGWYRGVKAFVPKGAGGLRLIFSHEPISREGRRNEL
jgi:hypothetical protein